MWRSDSTPAGTTPLPEFLPGPADPDFSHMLAQGGRLFMAANGGDGAGTELWMLDVSDIFVDGFESGDVTVWSGATP